MNGDDPMNQKPVECPACGEEMRDTGKREESKLTGRPMRIMLCPSCGNESGVSVTPKEASSS